MPLSNNVAGFPFREGVGCINTSLETIPSETVLSDLTQYAFFFVWAKLHMMLTFSTSHMYFERINAACWHLHMFKYVEYSFTGKWLSAVEQL